MESLLDALAKVSHMNVKSSAEAVQVMETVLGSTDLPKMLMEDGNRYLALKLPILDFEQIMRKAIQCTFDGPEMRQLLGPHICRASAQQRQDMKKCLSVEQRRDFNVVKRNRGHSFMVDLMVINPHTDEIYAQVTHRFCCPNKEWDYTPTEMRLKAMFDDFVANRKPRTRIIKLLLLSDPRPTHFMELTERIITNPKALGTCAKCHVDLDLDDHLTVTTCNICRFIYYCNADCALQHRKAHLKECQFLRYIRFMAMLRCTGRDDRLIHKDMLREVLHDEVLPEYRKILDALNQ